jgi:hypothetical protein
MSEKFQSITVIGVDRKRTKIDDGGNYDYYFNLSFLPNNEWQAVFYQHWKKHLNTLGTAQFLSKEPVLQINNSVGDAQKVKVTLDEIVNTVNKKFSDFESSLDSIDSVKK